MTNNEIAQVLIEKIRIALQKIQDTIEPRPGLDRYDSREHILFWKLGELLKEFVELHQISPNNVNEELSKNFKDTEKKIRIEGKRRDKEPCPSWFYKDHKTGKTRETVSTWILTSWDFINGYQDLERWNLVANLSGHMFKDKDGKSSFVRKRAEDLLPYFSKRDPPLNAKELQDIFVKEISKFENNPKRESEWQPLITQTFGKSKINISEAKENFLLIKSEVEKAIDENVGTQQREEFVKNMQLEALNSLRTLLRLIGLTDEKKFEKRLKDLGKIPTTIKTKHVEAKELYKILYSLIKDSNSRSKFLQRVTPYDLTLLNTKLKAVTNDEAYQEYLETQKLRKELFS
jgi:hypothetical protein